MKMSRSSLIRSNSRWSRRSSSSGALSLPLPGKMFAGSPVSACFQRRRTLYSTPGFREASPMLYPCFYDQTHSLQLEFTGVGFSLFLCYNNTSSCPYRSGFSRRPLFWGNFNCHTHKLKLYRSVYNSAFALSRIFFVTGSRSSWASW